MDPGSVPTHIQKRFSILFQYLFSTELKDFNISTWLRFSKLLLMEHNEKTSAELSSAVTNKIWKKRLNLEFPYFFNILCTFLPYSIHFQGLENRFRNFNTAWEPCVEFIAQEQASLSFKDTRWT